MTTAEWTAVADNPWQRDSPASRHLHQMALMLAAGRHYPMLDDEPQQCAEAMLEVLESLWKLRDDAQRYGLR